MGSGGLLGRNVEKQLEALGTLKQYEELDYEDLKCELDVSEDEMQAIMRGLRYNGLARDKTNETGERLYLPDW